MIGIKKIVEAIIKSNIWVSVSVSFFTYETLILCTESNLKESLFLCGFVFCSTLLIYNFQRLYKFQNSNQDSPTKTWFLKNKRLIICVCIISAIGTSVSAFTLNPESIILLSVLFFFSLFYVVKILPFKGGKIALREVPYFKLFLISFVWTMVIVTLPIVQFGSFLSLKELTLFGFEKGLFILALTIPFDIRDLKYDKPFIKTLPQSIGIFPSIIISNIALVLAIILSIQLYRMELYSFSNLIAVILSYAISMALTSLTISKQKDWYYGGVLDGMFLIQVLLLMAIQF